MGAPVLSKRELKALRHLASYGSGGGYLVGHRLDVTSKSYAKFRVAGLIEEAWTWASGSRPDIRLSDLGRAAIADPDQRQDAEAAAAMRSAS